MTLTAPGLRPVLGIVLLAALAVAAMSPVAALSPASAMAAAPEKAAEQDPFYEPVKPLVPKSPRSEQEEDKITAAALFAHARFLQQRGKNAEALRSYQRAARYSTPSSAILDEVVQLAFRLKRVDEGARYAVIASELNPDDPVLMRRLAEHLVDQGESERALKMYRLAARPKEQPEGPVAEAKITREIGRLSLLTGDYQKSAQAFDELLQAIDQPEKSGLTPDVLGEVIGKPELIYRLIAESYLLAERYDDAEKLFRRAEKAKSDPAEFSYRMARVEQKRGKIDAALKQMAEYFDTKTLPENDRPYRLLAELLEEKHGEAEKKSRGELIERLEKMWDVDTTNLELGGYLAAVELEADRLDKAETIYKSLLEIDPSLQWNEGLIEIQQKRGDAEKLIEAMSAAVAKTNTLATFEDVLEPALEDKQLTKQVLVAGEKSLKDGSITPEHALALAYFALSAKNPKAADRFFKEALNGDEETRNEKLGSWGLELFSAERFAESAQAFQDALANAKTPDEKARLNYFLSSALAMDDKTQAALTAAEQAASLSSEPTRFETRPAWVLYHAKQYDRARVRYAEFVAKHDDDFTSSDMRALLRETRLILSNICVQLDDMPQAEEWLEQVLDEFPEDIGALNDLGYLWTDQGKHLHRALEMVKKAVEAEPDNTAYRDSLGWAYYRLGEFDKAIAELEKAADVEQPDGVILDHLGDAYHKGGKKDQALQTWRRAVEAFQREDDKEMLAKTQAKIDDNK
ncbi:MAG: tetratricopeptide repeat protein [Pirellulaceae bacterium]